MTEQIETIERTITQMEAIVRALDTPYPAATRVEAANALGRLVGALAAVKMLECQRELIALQRQAMQG